MEMQLLMASSWGGIGGMAVSFGSLYASSLFPKFLFALSFPGGLLIERFFFFGITK